MNPRPYNDKIRFLNREGTNWYIDEITADVQPIEPSGETIETTPTKYPPPVDADINVISDTPYSGFDNLFFPTNRTVLVTSAGQDAGFRAGLQLAGTDRLQFHRWGLTGSVQVDTGILSGSVFYVNRQLAPVTLGVELGRTAWKTPDSAAQAETELPQDPGFRRQQDTLTGFVFRTFRTTNVQLSASYILDIRLNTTLTWLLTGRWPQAAFPSSTTHPKAHG